MRMTKSLPITRVAALLAALCVQPALAAAPLPCQADAVAQARKLLAFHSGNDDRAHVDEGSVKQLPSIANPANKKQRFLVLEAQGHIYKGNYRMRLIYHPLQKECVLMGQEILELANL